MVNFMSSAWPKYTQYGTIFPKNHVLLSNFFSSPNNMLFIRLFLANTWKKKSGFTGLVFSQTVVKINVVMDSENTLSIVLELYSCPQSFDRGRYFLF